MTLALTLTLMLGSTAAPSAPGVSADTLRLEVGSTAINGRVYAPHSARVRVQVGPADSKPITEWTNQLTLGDSAGRPIMRWVTRGTRSAPDGSTQTWEILQTYDRETLAPYGYFRTSSTGAFMRLTIEGTRVRGTRRTPPDTAVQLVDLVLQRPGFIASASDLVPLAAGLKEGAVMTAPVWGPNMTDSEVRIFTVLGRAPIQIEGTEWNAWKVEERRLTDQKLLATWYLVEESPYMVYGEVPLPDGRIQRMTEVAIPHAPR
ncbi:MAG TPA: hypothetical protein VGA78_11370 [Gemmatimonadales bacterium]